MTDKLPATAAEVLEEAAIAAGRHVNRIMVGGAPNDAYWRGRRDAEAAVRALAARVREQNAAPQPLLAEACQRLGCRFDVAQSMLDRARERGELSDTECAAIYAQQNAAEQEACLPQTASSARKADESAVFRVGTQTAPASAAPSARAVAHLIAVADELCEAVENEVDDIGGSRPIREILGELGPAVEAAKDAATMPQPETQQGDTSALRATVPGTLGRVRRTPGVTDSAEAQKADMEVALSETQQGGAAKEWVWWEKADGFAVGPKDVGCIAILFSVDDAISLCREHNEALAALRSPGSAKGQESAARRIEHGAVSPERKLLNEILVGNLTASDRVARIREVLAEPEPLFCIDPVGCLQGKPCSLLESAAQPQVPEDTARLDWLEREATTGDHPYALFRRNMPITRAAIDEEMAKHAAAPKGNEEKP